MPDEREVKIIIRTQHVGKEEAKNAKEQMEDLGKKSKETGDKFEKVTKNLSYNLTFIAWHFRYLGSIFKQVSRRWIRMAEDWIQNAADIEEAVFGIRVAASLFGRDTERATKLVEELVETGLIKYKDAAESVRNLLLTGLGMPEIEKTMKGLLSLSTLFTVAGKDLGDSINKVSAAVLRGTALMQSDLLTRTLLRDMTNQQRKAIEKSWSSLTKLERAQALYNQVLKLSIRTGELWRGEANLMAGQIYKLQTNIQLTKAALGEALRPVLDLVSDLMAKFRTIVESVSSRMSGLLSTTTILIGVFATLTATISFTMGVLLSFVKIWRGIQKEITATTGILKIFTLSGWKVLLIIGAISAAVTGLTYVYLKATGRLDKYKQSLAAVGKQLEELNNAQAGINSLFEESTEISEKDRIAHERRIEDITEALKRERALGLWANQMRIKDLEKQLRREQEDWALLQKEKGATAEEGNKGLLGGMMDTLEKIEKKTKEHSDNIKGIWRTLGVESFEEFKRSITDPTVWQNMFTDLGARIYRFLDTVKNWGIAIGKKIYEGIRWLVENPRIWLFLMKEIGDSINSTVETLYDIVSSIGRGLGIGLISSFVKTIDEITGSIEELSDAQQKQLKLLKKLWRAGIITQEQYQAEYERMIRDMEILRRKQEEAMPFWTKGWLGKIYTKFWEKGWIGTMKEDVEDAIKELRKKKPLFQFGGIVPGPRNQPVPIIAHGGERIIPAGEPAASGNITININNPVVRNESDIQRIAEAVSNILGLKRRWASLGAY